MAVTATRERLEVVGLEGLVGGRRQAELAALDAGAPADALVDQRQDLGRDVARGHAIADPAPPDERLGAGHGQAQTS